MPSSLLSERSAAETARSTAEHTPPGTIRVLHVINGEHYAGAERVQDLLAAQLGSFGFEVGFACVKPDEFPRLRSSSEPPLYEVPMISRFDLFPAWELVRIIRCRGYQLLHTHSVRSALVAGLASKLAGVPLVHHVHSPTGNDSTRRWRDRVNALLERLVLRRASALITVSGSLADHVRRNGFAEEKISVVPNGVPCRRPVPTRDPAKTDWTLGTVALFRPRKGIEVLLNALAILKTQGLPVRLRAVGGFETPEYERRIKRLTEQLGLDGDVDWTGFARNVDAQLAKMDLFVLPSLFGEGLPMVVLEAMSAGVPVVATRVEGIPEAVRDGRDGLIARPDDPENLAGVIGRVVRGEVDWHALRASALKRQAEKFSETSMAAGVADVYRRVLGEG